MRSLHSGTELTIRVRGTRYAITVTPRGPRRTIRPYEVHYIDAHGVRVAVPDLSAVLTRAEEFYVRCLASALREGVEFAAAPPAPEGDDGEGDEGDGEPYYDDPEAGPAIGSQRPAVASSDPLVCGHPGVMTLFSLDAEHCPHCNTTAPMGCL